VLPRNRYLLPAISALLAIALVGVLVLGTSKGGRSTAGQASGFDGAAIPGDVKAPTFALSGQDGRAVSLGSYRGRVAVLVFLAAGAPSGLDATCRTCVLVAQQVRGALDELEPHPPPKADTRAIFVSGELPVRGSANRLLAQTSLSTRAEYLTGDGVEVGRVWRAYRIALPATNDSKAEAATTVVLIDGRGFERVAFGIEQITPESLSHDIGLLEHD
jgi:cytochrome oxidase Cu insertion factor (SCO1/SenC/PrrC family)